MIYVKTICAYREFDDDNTLPSAKDNVTDTAVENKDKVLNHLKSGKLLFVAATTIKDIFTGKPIVGGLCTYTDGEYTWTSEELYYFEKYNLKLNADFINSIQ